MASNSMVLVTKDKLLHFKQKLDVEFSKFSGSYNDLTDKPGNATTEAAGFMSAADKAIVDALPNTYRTESQVSDAITAATADFITADTAAATYRTESQVSDAISTATANFITVSEVESKISAVYKPAGSVTFANLPELSEDILGYVYNVTTSFTTTDSFVEGSGKTYSAGTNVVCVVSGETYMWDVLAGMVDLSDYELASDLTEITNEEIDAMFA